jgi:hypothetical protein
MNNPITAEQDTANMRRYWSRIDQAGDYEQCGNLEVIRIGKTVECWNRRTQQFQWRSVHETECFEAVDAYLLAVATLSA